MTVGTVSSSEATTPSNESSFVSRAIAPAGSYVLAPPGVAHCFRNVGDSPARALNIHAPGGFVEYRRELEALRATGTEPGDAFFERHDVFDV